MGPFEIPSTLLFFLYILGKYYLHAVSIVKGPVDACLQRAEVFVSLHEA